MQTQDLTDVSIRRFAECDYPAIAELNNINFPEFKISVEEWRSDDQTRLAKCQAARWVAEYSHCVVGFAQYEQFASVYHPRKFNIEVMVDPMHRQRGIGRQLYATLIDALAPFEPVMVDIWSREDMVCRRAFLEHRGFLPDQRIWSSALDLTTFDPAPFWSYVDALRAQDIVVRTLAELRADNTLDERALYDLWSSVHADVAVAPSQTPSTRTFDEWRPRNLEHPTLYPEAYFIALHGDCYVGTTNLWHAPEADVIRTGLTGVRSEYRGRGIAFGLKVLALDFAKRRGYRSTDTENASTNAGMLSINERLGFIKRPAWIHYAGAWDKVASAAV